MMNGCDSPFITSDLPGTGGAFKITPEDFEVEELPAYLPSGVGEHVYLWVEKRGRNTAEVARALAATLGVGERQVGWAGLKDRQALARQWFSVLTPRDPPRCIAGDGFRVLAASRHGNKLRPGHLRGNRFAILLRGADDAGLARAVLDALTVLGAPNWFGQQRFGRDGDNAALGLALLRRGEHPALSRARRDRFLRKLALSALQAELFNRVLALRLSEGAFGRIEEGDLLQLGEDGGGPVFACDPEVDRPRFSTFAVSPTGPMFGPKMRRPDGDPARRETQVLSAAGLDVAAFDLGGRETEGTRRSLRVRPREPVIEAAAGGLRVCFSLPPGAYATSVLREITKG